MKRIFNILFFYLFVLAPCSVLAHEGHHAGPYHQHIAEIGVVIFSAVLALIVFVYYRQK